MIPDGNNVYSSLTAPEGLLPVCDALQREFGRNAASWRRSGFDGHEILKLQLDQAELDSVSLGYGEYLFNGAVGGSLDEIRLLLERISGVLQEAGITHRFEIYDDDHELVRTVP